MSANNRPPTGPFSLRPTLVLRLPNRAAFLASYFHQGDVGSIFVPGESALRAGERVDLHVAFTSDAREFHTRGVVRWKRTSVGHKLPPGVAVELAGGERSTRDMLIDYAHGRDVRWMPRKDKRLPLALEIQYATDSVLLSDVTDDLSRGGAFIAADKLLPVGTEIEIKLKLPTELFASRLKGQVAWHQAIDRRGMGVRFVFDSEAARQRFDQLVGKLQQRVEEEFEIHAVGK